MPDELRAQIRERFNARCACCGIHEEDAGSTLTVDRHHPRSVPYTPTLAGSLYGNARFLQDEHGRARK